MSKLTLERAARTTPVTSLTDTEAVGIDLDKMRKYRLGRLREQLIKQNVGACVLLSPYSIRYATGFRSGAIFQTHIQAGYLFVPADGPVILFDGDLGPVSGPGLGTINEIRDDVLPLSYFFGGTRLDEWYARWAAQITELVDQHCSDNRRLGVERAGTRAPGAFAGHNVEVVDAVDVIEAARIIKSPEEILCMNAAIAAAEDGMWRMREALQPGLTEVELWSHLWSANTQRGGDWCECRLLSSGDRTNPWLQEASHRMIRAGDLVAFDTDMIGPFGYCADVSRTYFCGPGRPTAYQKELYQRAYEEVHQNLELMRPGASFRDITHNSFRQPEKFRAQHYPVVAHGVGMSDEWPTIFYPDDESQFGYDGVLETGMTICVESYVGEAGGPEGVKLEQQIVITDNGHIVLSRFPFEEELLN